jgi:DNA-binding transcriptional LysR family regulator
MGSSGERSISRIHYRYDLNVMTTKDERSDRVRGVWSWLPAFRAVAETEHLPTAAGRHHVTPAALSRSLRLLEDALERPLFHRVGRGLKITSAGERLAGAVRDAMRLVDDALDDLSAGRLAGPLHVSAPAALTDVVLDVTGALRDEHPDLVVHLTGAHADPAAALWRGDLDLVLSWTPVDDDRLARRRAAEVETAVYGVDDAPDRAFAALGPSRTLPDPWPPGRPRRVALVCDSLPGARAACDRGLLAVLPRTMGAGLTERAPAPPLILHSTARPTLQGGGKAELFLAALEYRLG